MKILVLTPVKNEAWILDRFLSVTSQFADHIIVLDQNSTDGSLDIYPKYPKVILVKNENDKYDEASRQLLLIQKARELVPGPKILLAIDSDEILAADAMETQGWQTMLNSSPGTLLCFEKPELYKTPEHTIRYDNTWPLGFVDDGTEHKPSLIHSIRVPVSSKGHILHLHDVKILHYAMTRMSAQNAKWRMYSVVENLNNTKNLRLRRRMYTSNKDWTSSGSVEKSPGNWFENWERKGIDMRNIEDVKFYWQDLFVLKMFKTHGEHRFWNDDIWNYPWNEAKTFFINQGEEGLPVDIKGPGKIRTVSLKFADKILLKLYSIFS